MGYRGQKGEYYRDDREVESVGRGRTDCVKDTVARILDAQRRVAGVSGHDCASSCKQSIEDLLSPGRDRNPRHTTIPFMLVCSDSCSTFYGSGFVNKGHGRDRYFECVESPVFKVKGFVGGSDNCVRLELLSPVYHTHHHDEKEEGKSHATGSHGRYGCKASTCGFFNHGPIRNFCYTGVCITVNLDCFCGISCLHPITPINE